MMQKMVANTDVIPLIAQHHGMSAGARSRTRRIPVGNAMPRAIPSGVSTRMTQPIRSGSGRPRRSGKAWFATRRAPIDVTRIAPSTKTNDLRRSGSRSDRRDPSPVEASNAVRTTDSACVGCPRNSTSFCIMTISIDMNPRPSALK
jgi:hypothetical protein